MTESVFIRQGLWFDGKIAVRYLLGDVRRDAQIGGHAVHRVDEILDLVVRIGRDFQIEIADRDGLSQADAFGEPARDAERDPDTGRRRDQQNDARSNEKKRARSQILAVSLGYDLLHIVVADFLNLIDDCERGFSLIASFAGGKCKSLGLRFRGVLGCKLLDLIFKPPSARAMRS